MIDYEQTSNSLSLLTRKYLPSSFVHLPWKLNFPMIPHVHLSLGRSVCLSKSFTSMLLSEHLFSSLMAFKSKYQNFDIFVFSWSVTVRKMLSDSQSMIISWTQFYPFPCNGSFPNLFQLPFSPPHALHSPFFLVRRGAFLHFVHPRILGHFYFIFF